VTGGPGASDRRPGSGPGLLVANAVRDGERCELRAVGGVVVELGPSVVRHPGDEVLDAEGMAILPGLVNGHTHAAMTLFRGFGSSLGLKDWLESCIWPAERRLTASDVYWGARLGAIEMIRSGTVRFFDMYWHPAEVGRAAADSGLRAVVGVPLFDGRDASRLPRLRDFALESLDAIAEVGSLVRPSLSPHSMYMVSGPSLQWVGEVAAERGLPIHLHFAETVTEVADWRRDHDQSMAGYLSDGGLLGPRTLLAHACVVDADDYRIVADSGATVVTNPVSNLKLANGRIFPYPMARDAGVRIGLGTDGAASNNGLDLLSDAKTFSLIQKHGADDPTLLPAAEVLAIAQGRRSALLAGGGFRGDGIAVGAPADFILVDTGDPAMNPGEVPDGLIFAAGSRAVDTTVVAGRVLMRHGAIPGVEEVVGEVRARARRLWA